MVFGKHKHNLTTILRFAHFDPGTNAPCIRRKTTVCSDPPKDFNKSSSYTFDTTSLTKVKGLTTY